jgi:hypothetical protein
VLVVGAGSTGSAELYDPTSGIWTATGNMVTGHSGETATLLVDGTVLVAGDNDNPGIDPVTAELFDPATGRWTATGAMVTRRTFHTATLLRDGRVLVAGGAPEGAEIGHPTTSEVYDPSDRAWTATGDMMVTRSYFTSILLADGRVLAVGGRTLGGGGEGSAELYDPTSGTWSLAGNMIDGRYGHTATLLGDGHVLVAGGFSGARGPITSAELYDPNSGPLIDFGFGSWSATASMVDGRAGAAAILLSDGQVLITGGLGGAGMPIAAAELYHPSSSLR